MVPASLRELLTSGRLGPVELGARRAEVEAALGPPDDVEYVPKRKRRPPRIWKYGDLELHFDPDGLLFLVHADYFAVPRGGPRIALDPWIVSGELRLDAAERALTAAGFAIVSTPEPYYGETYELRPRPGVSLLFEARAGASAPDARLVSMSVSRPSEPRRR